jgi:hypothetical protein
MREILDVDGAPSHSPAHVECATGEVEIGGQECTDVVAGYGVYGGQGDDEAADWGSGLVEQPGEYIAGNRARNPFHVANGQLPGGVAEDRSFAPQRFEQAAQTNGELPAGVTGQAVHGLVDVCPGDLPQRADAGLRPRGQGRLKDGEVAADAVISAGLAFVAALAALEGHPGADLARDRFGQGVEGGVYPHLVGVPVQFCVLNE